MLGVHHVGGSDDDDGTAVGGREDRSGGHPSTEGGKLVYQSSLYDLPMLDLISTTVFVVI